MHKRRLLLIASRSLFGTGVAALLDQQRNQLRVKMVPTVEQALRTSSQFFPDVVVCFKESSAPGEQAALQELAVRYHARVIHCTLESDRLTVYDQTRIEHATVDDLLAAVLK
ncbi:MAG: hypothetical protein AB1515_09265 [Nitrospirota bacterium]